MNITCHISLKLGLAIYLHLEKKISTSPVMFPEKEANEKNLTYS